MTRNMASLPCILFVFGDKFLKVTMTEITVDGEDGALPYLKQSDRKFTNRNNPMIITGDSDEKSPLMHAKTSQPNSQDRDFHNIIQSTALVGDPIPLNYAPHNIRRSVQSLLDMPQPRMDSTAQGGQLIPSSRSKAVPLGAEDLDIPWNDLVLKERIGAGICPAILKKL